MEGKRNTKGNRHRTREKLRVFFASEIIDFVLIKEDKANSHVRFFRFGPATLAPGAIILDVLRKPFVDNKGEKPHKASYRVAFASASLCSFNYHFKVSPQSTVNSTR
jgi:hypothetical protein